MVIDRECILDEGDVTILNPGSISLPRQMGYKKTFMIMEIDEEENISYTLCEI